MAYYILLIKKYYATNRVCNIPLLLKEIWRKFENSINICNEVRLFMQLWQI